MTEQQPDIQIDGSIWIVIVRQGQKNLVAYGKTISIAVKNMEYKYGFTVPVPCEYADFADVTPEHYRVLKYQTESPTAS